MKGTSLRLIAPLFAATALPLMAASIPYGNVGTIPPQQTLTATTTGDILGYFVQGGAASGGGAVDLDFVRLFDVTTGTRSGFAFNNQTTVPGSVMNFGHVNTGDQLVFELENASNGNEILASDATYSHDNTNHAYVTTWLGGTLNTAFIPAGIYVGMEDLNKSNSDWNFDDDSFVFTNIDARAITPAPEPAGLVLLGTGLLSAVGMMRRKLRA